MKRYQHIINALLFVTFGHIAPTQACTGITLKADDGAVLLARTMEWGEFDMNGRLMIIPRGQEFTGATPDGKPGLKWKGKYGVVGIDMLEKGLLSDGINEAGLSLALLYHPGIAEYAKYDPTKAKNSMGPTDLAQYLLTTCSTVDCVKAEMEKIQVAPVVDSTLGFAPPVHFIVAEPSGKEIVIEFLKGKTTINEAPLGVLTNAPTYDWHITNLQNYINLSPVAIPNKDVKSVDFKPLGVGSGMIGLPGDFTPPSRFVRAVAFTATARNTSDGPETVYEIFRILDNFNVPLSATWGVNNPKQPKDLRSSTLWTVAYDTKNKVMYYHTQNNRRVRMVDLSKIDFASLPAVIHQPLDEKKAQDIEDRTPK
ncbi:MAG: choloylglycine hydrolase [Gammaproteobacteria bacterium 39-13]|nr:choloylglycine hydrolase family protein [Gammaproteobacteria bacterium]OJV90535.1 MAG: choloylglycine hydrolase [Gammaproteobacteria bacterium 39-13]